MSIMGTGAAAAVAQTGLVAQQRAREVDKRVGEQQRVSDAAVVAFEEKLKTPTAADDMSGELPDRAAPGYEQLYGRDGQLHGPGFDEGDAGDGTDPPRASLDVTG